MNAETYRVVVSGQTLQGVSAEEAIGNFVESFKVPADRARSLIGQVSVVKRAIDEQTAQKYVSALNKAGFVAYLEVDFTFDTQVDSTSNQKPTGDANKADSLKSAKSNEQVSNNYKIDRSKVAPVQMDSIDTFLDSIGLSHLGPLMKQHAITPDMLSDLTDADLQSIGVAAIGERKKFLSAVRHIQEDETAKQAIHISQENDRAGQIAKKNWLIGLAITSGIIGVIGASITSSSIGGFLGFSVVTFILLWVYYLPSIIAFENQTEHRWIIFIANCFFGATLFGWVILLVFAKRLVSAKAAATVGVIGAIAGMT